MKNRSFVKRAGDFLNTTDVYNINSPASFGEIIVVSWNLQEATRETVDPFCYLR